MIQISGDVLPTVDLGKDGIVEIEDALVQPRRSVVRAVALLPIAAGADQGLLLDSEATACIDASVGNRIIRGIPVDRIRRRTDLYVLADKFEESFAGVGLVGSRGK